MSTKEIIDQLDTSHVISVAETFGEFIVELKIEHLKETLRFFKNASYAVLMDLTAVDYLEPQIRTKIIYWLHNPDTLQRVRLTTFIARGEPVPSVTDIYGGANWYERELYDMFGVNIQNHPDLKRILMPDNWVGHPMRRDYPLTEVPVQFKHDVKPKIPSQIIPNVKLRVIHD